jgi:hypothetical protein
MPPLVGHRISDKTSRLCGNQESWKVDASRSSFGQMDGCVRITHPRGRVRGDAQGRIVTDQ